MIGRDDHDRLALVADLVDGQHRLVLGLKAECLRPGTSSWVSTAATPGSRSAPVRSTARMRARGCGLRRVAPHSMSAIHRSDENANSPVTLSVPSGRGTLIPTPASPAAR